MHSQRLSLVAAALVSLVASASAWSQAAQPARPGASALTAEDRQERQPQQNLARSSSVHRPTAAGPTDESPPVPLSTYSVPWRSVNAGGGLRSSANYRLADAVGQAAVGGSLGTSYGAYAGFWFPATVSLVLAPEATSIPRGGQLRILVTATNNTDSRQTFDFWSDATLPGGGHYPVFGPFTGSLNAHQSRSATLVHRVPNNAPLATFTYNAYVGLQAASSIWDDAHFPFTITALAAPGEGGAPARLARANAAGAHRASASLKEERAPIGNTRPGDKGRALAMVLGSEAESADGMIPGAEGATPGRVVLEPGHWEGEFAVTAGPTSALASASPGTASPDAASAALTGGTPQAPALRTALEGNYPNPFNPSTTIRYQLGEAGLVVLRVYDLRGRLVRTLMEGAQQPGSYAVHWDGRDTAGRAVASGVYLCRLRIGGYQMTRTLVLAK